MDVVRTVAGAVGVQLDRMVPGAEALDVRHHVGEGAAAVVLSCQNQHRRADGVGEVDRVALAHEVRKLVGGRAPQQRPVVRLQQRRTVVVAALVVGHRHAGHAAPPQIGVLPELQKRDVTAPGPSEDDGP